MAGFVFIEVAKEKASSLAFDFTCLLLVCLSSQERKSF